MPSWIKNCNLNKNQIVAKRNKERQINYDNGRINVRNLGKRYTPEECARILAHEVPDRELATQLGRPVQSIQMKRTNLLKNKH